MDCKLVVSSGPGRGLELALDAPRAFTIGRSNSADLKILDSGISRIHCDVAPDGSEWKVRDRGSRNGVHVRGEQVREHRLAPGDEFSIGRSTLIKLDAIEPTTEMPDGYGDSVMTVQPLGVGAPSGPISLAGAVAPTEPSLVGRSLGEFRVAEKLAHSSASTTYRALQPTLNRNVVLQVFNHACSRDPTFRDEVIERVRHVSPLIHPTVVQLFDLEEADGLLFVVMEHFKGRTLSSHLAKQHFVPVRSAIQVAQQLCEALMHASEMQLPVPSIHPDDVWIDDEYRAKVQYFREPERGDAASTVDGLVYRAPELLSPSAQGGASSAVYSVGAILYQMVGGIPPFRADNVDLLRAKVLRDDAPDLRKLNYQASPALCDVIRQTMSKKPAERPAGARELDEALRKITAPTAR